MAKVYSEAVQDAKTGKWGFYVEHEEDGQLLEPFYVFDTQEEAEEELISALKGLADISRDS